MLLHPIILSPPLIEAGLVLPINLQKDLYYEKYVELNLISNYNRNV